MEKTFYKLVSHQFDFGLIQFLTPSCKMGSFNEFWKMRMMYQIVDGFSSWVFNLNKHKFALMLQIHFLVWSSLPYNGGVLNSIFMFIIGQVYLMQRQGLVWTMLSWNLFHGTTTNGVTGIFLLALSLSKLSDIDFYCVNDIDRLTWFVLYLLFQQSGVGSNRAHGSGSSRSKLRWSFWMLVLDLEKRLLVIHYRSHTDLLEIIVFFMNVWFVSSFHSCHWE